LKPFLIGKDPQRIEDIWQTSMVSGYWRNGPIMNNAISGVDMALWDIKGKLANLPVYQLLGGKCREAAAIYRHADGRDVEELADNVQRFKEQGVRHIRCQLGGYGGRHIVASPDNSLPGAYYDPDAYARSVPKMFEAIRNRFGFELELIHDVHERLSTIEAVRLAKQLEPYRLFYLEDALAPEQLEGFRMIRAQAATPIAMGELSSPPRMGAADLGRADRLHSGAYQRDRRVDPGEKAGDFVRSIRRTHRLAGPGDVSPVGARREPASGSEQRELRHSGVVRLLRPDPRSVSGLPRRSQRLCLLERSAGIGHRHRRDVGREVPVPERPAGLDACPVAGR